MPQSDQYNKYPDVDALRCDPRMARLLFRAYYDELTTISTYTYNSMILSHHCPQYASLFESLSMTEMHHFRLLGKAIHRMGGNPTIRIDLRIPGYELCADASRQNIDSISRQMVRTSIVAEQTAAWEYRTLAGKTRDELLKQILCRLAADEEEHARLLQNLCAH